MHCFLRVRLYEDQFACKRWHGHGEGLLSQVNLTGRSVGSFANKNSVSFDPRNYGFSKRGQHVRRQPYVEVKEAVDASGIVHLHVRLET